MNTRVPGAAGPRGIVRGTERRRPRTRGDAPSPAAARPRQTTRTIIVRADLPSVFGTATAIETFPSFLRHVSSVRVTGPGTSRWVVVDEAGREFWWFAHLTRFEAGRRLAWNSSPEGLLLTSGQITFTDLGPAETQVTVTFQCVPAFPAEWTEGPPLAGIGPVLEEELRRFKAHVEKRPVEA